ncbi:helix-turn-helix domain-containing protein [Haladaptatus sp. GCM10025707]|uniref:helix-turn-helix domain-containing protein n=1 Tax=unclassified Haladaptatus TaxID=2622732 RepID=UPI0036212284
MGILGENGDGGTTTRRILSLLGDSVAREILQAGSGGPVTIEDLTEQTGVSQSTVYRRLSDLVESGLVREDHARVSAPNKRAFVTAIDSLAIDITTDGIAVHLDQAPSTGVAVRELNLEPLDFDLDERVMTVRLALDDELMAQFEKLWERTRESPSRTFISSAR